MLRLILSAAALLAVFASVSSAAPGCGPSVDRAWARATPGLATTGAAYLSITSPADDRLVGMASPVARSVELHTHIDENGTMRMQEVAGGLVLRANQMVELKPGAAMHLMLIGLNRKLIAGESFPLTLVFEQAGTRDVMVRVERLGATGPSAPPAAAPALRTAKEIGGPFTLVDQNGCTVTDALFRGRYMLVYFGYTHCPDACPTALSTMADTLAELPPEKRAKVQPVFITVDPMRDTQAVMKDYVSSFEDAHIVALTGTQEQVDAALSAYQVRAKRQNRPDGDYAMSHSSTIHIVDPEGRFVGLERPEQLAARLSQLLP
jgi:protein SCO1